MDVPDPLPLRNIEVPAEVTAVIGCSCGGLNWHRDDCTLWGLPYEAKLAAVVAAEARLQEWTAALNARLREST